MPSANEEDSGVKTRDVVAETEAGAGEALSDMDATFGDFGSSSQTIPSSSIPKAKRSGTAMTSISEPGQVRARIGGNSYISSRKWTWKPEANGQLIAHDNLSSKVKAAVETAMALTEKDRKKRNERLIREILTEDRTCLHSRKVKIVSIWNKRQQTSAGKDCSKKGVACVVETDEEFDGKPMLKLLPLLELLRKNKAVGDDGYWLADPQDSGTMAALKDDTDWAVLDLSGPRTGKVSDRTKGIGESIISKGKK